MFPMIAMKLEEITNDNYRSERILTARKVSWTTGYKILEGY